MKISNIDLYNLCNFNNWFTLGTQKQYDKLFKRNTEGANIYELATIIWLCSETEKSIEHIETSICIHIAEITEV